MIKTDAILKARVSHHKDSGERHVYNMEIGGKYFEIDSAVEKMMIGQMGLTVTLEDETDLLIPMHCVDYVLYDKNKMTM